MSGSIETVLSRSFRNCSKSRFTGRYVQDSMNVHTNERVLETIAQVLVRNPSWIDFYGRYLSENSLDPDATERVADNQERLTQAALAEANYIRALWEGDLQVARLALEDTIEETGRADTLLAGWHNIWLAACYQAEGDSESARLNYRRARSRLGVNLAISLSPAASPAGITEFRGAICTRARQNSKPDFGGRIQARGSVAEGQVERS